MTEICYVPKKFSEDHLIIIGHANGIIKEYGDADFALTLRSLYYQFVARGLFKENTQRQYDRLGNILNDARLAGLTSWTAIEDNMRSLQGHSTVSGPKEAILKAREALKLDLWAAQPWQPEVWVEKDAMVGVLEGICSELRVNFFACRGYVSQSAMWRAGQRMADYVRRGKRPIVFHFGDHDPSGIDMTRDNADRLAMFAGVPVQVVRLGLNMPQVERYNPPPNWAKVTDSRFKTYLDNYGDKCWELDALHPSIIRDLIERNVKLVRDEKLWGEALAQEAEDLDKIDRIIEENGWKDE